MIYDKEERRLGARYARIAGIFHGGKERDL
jgi:hypothetical protein